MPGHQPEFTVEDGALLVDNMMRFLPYERDRFFLADDTGMRLHFFRNEEGEIDQIQVLRGKEVVGALLPKE